MSAGAKRARSDDAGNVAKKPAAAPAVLAPVKVGRVPVFVMMQLDWMSEDGSALRCEATLTRQLADLQLAGVRGVMADIWWGLCERTPGKYSFGAVQALCAKLCKLGLQLQATMSFHQCGGNVGDPVQIPLPAFILDHARKNDLLYRNGSDHVSEDCLSLSADQLSVFDGPSGKRTPLQCYRDFIAAFATACGAYVGSTIIEIQIGMGPCGELRYPSYMLSKGWEYPGVGLVMADDKGMREMLKRDTGLETLPAGMPVDQNALPDATPMFQAGKPDQELFRQGNGKVFFEWYSRVLLEHGEAILAEAAAALKQANLDGISGKDLVFSVKISGLHWHVMHPSRATEACAGYNNCTHDAADAYRDIAAMLARAVKTAGRPILFNFTCLEMTNTDNNGNPQTLSAPEDLIAQVRRACVVHNVPLSGENALEFETGTGGWAFERMVKQMRGWSPGRDRMHGLTLLRLNDRMVSREGLPELAKFVAST